MNRIKVITEVVFEMTPKDYESAGFQEVLNDIKSGKFQREINDENRFTNSKVKARIIGIVKHKKC